MQPSGIPVDSLTHANFAFAYIGPKTYQLTTMDSATPEDLFQKVANVRSLKSGKGDLDKEQGSKSRMSVVCLDILTARSIK